MLDEEVDKADFVVFDLRQRRYDVVGDKIRASRFWGKGKGFLEPRTSHVDSAEKIR